MKLKQHANNRKLHVNCTNLSVIRGPKLEFGSLGMTGTAPEKENNN